MNNVGFGYGVRGLSNLASLGDIENKRRWAEYEQSQAEAKGQAEAVGTLVGGVMGGVKGYYNKKQDQHNTEQATKRKEYDEQNYRDYVDARNRGESAPIPEPFTPEEFDFVHSVRRDLKDIGWLD
jgi:hypothetical protein